MRDFTQKEIAMRSDKEWNVMSPEDAMVMALVNALDTKSNKIDKVRTKTAGKSDKNKNDSKKESAKRKDERIPDWKKIPPKS